MDNEGTNGYRKRVGGTRALIKQHLRDYLYSNVLSTAFMLANAQSKGWNLTIETAPFYIVGGSFLFFSFFLGMEIAFLAFTETDIN